MTTVLVIVAILIFLALGNNLYNAQQEVTNLTLAKDELEYEVCSLEREKIKIQVELAKLKLLQKSHKVNIKLAWQYLYYLAEKECLHDFLEYIKDDFDEYLTKMDQANKLHQNYLETDPIDCTRYLHSIIDEHKEWKQELRQLEEA